MVSETHPPIRSTLSGEYSETATTAQPSAPRNSHAPSTARGRRAATLVARKSRSLCAPDDAPAAECEIPLAAGPPRQKNRALDDTIADAQEARRPEPPVSRHRAPRCPAAAPARPPPAAPPP